MRDKRIVVTGGTTGIGRATVRLLAQQGAHVVTVGRDADALAAALESMRDLPGRVHGITADLGTRAGVEALFAAADERLGGLDALVSNAALGADPIDAMEEGLGDTSSPSTWSAPCRRPGRRWRGSAGAGKW
ncbi:SDR family NAD(P)-dependent oxidoreductase [Sphingomonas sp. BK580]|uniref:SDR family NAD(P)-dependent oxidoreductase n=1 Tax=Sphingomonas sp. BK580 TaxID=2586972 RepID=UPI001850DB92|nr:SDR family NAD(P)-dependent oxidoreductase [Sphingomonas sp. BK580]MBB3692161.1 NAD(P)-dependent dehydrogenase (short-subunit alcohol dehydrogenase family) [Sphingomonas sp. BK580]